VEYTVSKSNAYLSCVRRDVSQRSPFTLRIIDKASRDVGRYSFSIRFQGKRTRNQLQPSCTQSTCQL